MIHRPLTLEAQRAQREKKKKLISLKSTGGDPTIKTSFAGVTPGWFSPARVKTNLLSLRPLRLERSGR